VPAKELKELDIASKWAFNQDDIRIKVWIEIEEEPGFQHVR
tara:strand:- start:127 stop:249 length:123 start_codon:yes stop_codon:yes gene_type:complete